MNVADALAKRKTIRAFTDEGVDDATIRELLVRASRAPSGGNVQPWRIYVLNGDAMSRFNEHVATSQIQDTPAYEIYPQSLKEPYRSSRFKVGEDMYALLGIAREDKQARIARLMENFRFFGAPAAIFCYVDRQMGPPQWSDLGMFLQSFMLLATEAGLATCPQEAWAARPDTVAAFLEPPEELMMFCAVAIGHADPDAPVNQLVSDRTPVDEFATFVR